MGLFQLLIREPPDRVTDELYRFLDPVTPYNIANLQELVNNGPLTHPGARYVVRDTGDRIDLRYVKNNSCSLQYGWVVERHLRDGE